jgi:hypothetical protein
MVRARHTADRGALGRGGHAISGAIVTRDEPTLDQLFAEPIVQQLMVRDGIDEATTRNVLQQAAAGQVTKLGSERPLSRARSPLRPSKRHRGAD